MDFKPLDGAIIGVYAHELDIFAEVISAVSAEKAVVTRNPRL